MHDLTLFLTPSASGAVDEVMPLATRTPTASGEPNHGAGRSGAIRAQLRHCTTSGCTT